MVDCVGYSIAFIFGVGNFKRGIYKVTGKISRRNRYPVRLGGY